MISSSVGLAQSLRMQGASEALCLSRSTQKVNKTTYFLCSTQKKCCILVQTQSGASTLQPRCHRVGDGQGKGEGRIRLYFVHLCGELPQALNCDAGFSQPCCHALLQPWCLKGAWNQHLDWLGPPCTEELRREQGEPENIS